MYVTDLHSPLCTFMNQHEIMNWQILFGGLNRCIMPVSSKDVLSSSVLQYDGVLWEWLHRWALAMQCVGLDPAMFWWGWICQLKRNFD